MSAGETPAKSCFSLLWNILILHFLWHPCAPDQEAEGSPGIIAAGYLVSPHAVVPIPPEAPSPVVRTPAAVSAQPLGGYEAQSAAVAPAPW